MCTDIYVFTILQILLSMFVLPVIFWLIKFHEEERARSEDFNVNVQEQRKKVLLKKQNCVYHFAQKKAIYPQGKF